MDIVAPYSGVIVKRYVDCGESVTTMPAVTVAEIIDDSELLMEFSLPQELFGKVNINTEVSLEISGLKEEKMAKITVASPNIDESTRTFRCQASIDNKEGTWRSGLFVKGKVLYKGNETSLHAPKEAFVQEDGKWMARVKEKNQVILKPVEVSSFNEKEVEIQNGLTFEDILIIEK
jgi:RND family efflux transporter MFP subunit